MNTLPELLKRALNKPRSGNVAMTNEFLSGAHWEADRIAPIHEALERFVNDIEKIKVRKHAPLLHASTDLDYMVEIRGCFIMLDEALEVLDAVLSEVLEKMEGKNE